LNSIVVKPRFTKLNYTEAVDGEIRCDILTVEDVDIFTLISSKQNVLIPGTNIIIDSNNIISSSGGITQSQLDTKQKILTAGTNIIIDSNNMISSSGGIT
jgi:hypothetical protein